MFHLASGFEDVNGFLPRSHIRLQGCCALCCLSVLSLSLWWLYHSNSSAPYFHVEHAFLGCITTLLKFKVMSRSLTNDTAPAHQQRHHAYAIELIVNWQYDHYSFLKGICIAVPRYLNFGEESGQLNFRDITQMFRCQLQCLHDVSAAGNTEKQRKAYASWRFCWVDWAVKERTNVMNKSVHSHPLTRATIKKAMVSKVKK